MALLIKWPLLFAIYVTSAASALAVTTAPASTLEDFTEDPGTEHFYVQKSSCSPTCPLDWVTSGRRCFKYVDQSVAWIAAETHCLRLGANLVSIHNDVEYQVVKALIRAHDPEENPTWIGLSACQEKNNWIWSDGTNHTYTNWNSNEPNFSNGECCVHMNWADQKNWNDIPCSRIYPFVCVQNVA